MLRLHGALDLGTMKKEESYEQPGALQESCRTDQTVEEARGKSTATESESDTSALWTGARNILPRWRESA